MPFNILIVDDSSPMRAVIKKVIQASGFDVGEIHEADSGKEALQILNDQWLDVVLSDYNMPEMNGLEMLQHMKRDEMMKGIPVIMITTEGGNERIDEFIKEGACAYIRKPFTPEEIRSRLQELLGVPNHGQAEDGPSNESLDF